MAFLTAATLALAVQGAMAKPLEKRNASVSYVDWKTFKVTGVNLGLCNFLKLSSTLI